MIKLVIPGTAPSVNHMYRNHTIKGRRMRVITKNGQEWIDAAIIYAKQWQRKTGWSKATGKVVMKLWYYFPDKRRRDTHNTLKGLLDALEDAGLYEDDKMVLPRIMDFETDKHNPRIEITIERLEEEGE
jgi:crossover junction endodeoxyribonuclease RusA